jgi:hypothetical protein
MPREYRTKDQRDSDLALARIAGMAELARQVDPGVMSCASVIVARVIIADIKMIREWLDAVHAAPSRRLHSGLS